MIIYLIFFVIILLVIHAKNKKQHNKEYFEERPIYKRNLYDISRCPNYNCLMYTDNTCNKWCLKNVNEDKKSAVCRKRCNQITKTMIESLMQQYARMGDAYYMFGRFGGKRLYE